MTGPLSSGCKFSYKDTILKAIHNSQVAIDEPQKAVNSPTKIQFWKQYTTNDSTFRSLSCCKFSYKDTILKAIHNGFKNLSGKVIAVNSPTKIQFWKQYTTYYCEEHCIISCKFSYKDTILKAIHNPFASRRMVPEL